MRTAYRTMLRTALGSARRNGHRGGGDAAGGDGAALEAATHTWDGERRRHDLGDATNGCGTSVSPGLGDVVCIGSRPRRQRRRRRRHRTSCTSTAQSSSRSRTAKPFSSAAAPSRVWGPDTNVALDQASWAGRRRSARGHRLLRPRPGTRLHATSGRERSGRMIRRGRTHRLATASALESGYQVDVRRRQRALATAPGSRPTGHRDDHQAGRHARTRGDGGYYQGRRRAAAEPLTNNGLLSEDCWHRHQRRRRGVRRAPARSRCVPAALALPDNRQVGASVSPGDRWPPDGAGRR